MGFVHRPKTLSGIAFGTGTGRITMIEVREIVGVGNGQCFLMVMAYELLATAPVLDCLACAGTKEKGHDRNKKDSGDHMDQPSCSSFLKSMIAALARAM